MILYFRNCQGKRCGIGQPDNEREAMKMIQDFLDDHNYKSYYTRTWEQNGEIWYDVGSHSEFFILSRE